MKKKYLIETERETLVIDDHRLGLFLSFDYNGTHYPRVFIRPTDYFNLELKEDGAAKIVIVSDYSSLADRLAEFEVKNEEV